MDESSVIVLCTILLTVILSAFFSGIEIAFISANRLKIAIDKEQGGLSSKILGYFSKKPSWFIGTMLLGNNVTIVIYSIMMGKAVEPVFEPYLGAGIATMMVQTIISTIILLFFAEFLPKTIFRINANNILSGAAVPLMIVYVILFIPTFITIGIAELILRLFIKKENDDDDFVKFEKVDLDDFLEDGLSANLDDEEQDYEVKLFHNALNFNEVIARDCMVPRNEIVAVELNSELDLLRDKFISTNMSKILVYKENIDNIIGYVHSFEMFKNPDSIKAAMLPVSIIPETMTANKILEDLIKRNRSVAIVLDEYGGTSGILTMEDCIEEIFGEIEDEHDIIDTIQEKISDTEYLFGGRMEIDLINDKYKFKLPESEAYETLAGFIINKLQNIPKEGDIISHERYQMTIVGVSSSKIELVRIKIKEEDF